jgi:Ca2+-binding EF-hand superfamily protein
MKTFLISATAIAAVIAVVPALAQTPPAASAPHPMEMRMHMQMQPMTRAQVTQMVQEHFAKLDANKDGFVTKAEMDSAHEQMRSKITAKVEQRMGEHDGAMPDRGAMFDRFDSNHDGSISREEFMAAKPMMEEHRVIVMKGGDGHAMMGMGMHRMGMRFGGHMFERADANNDGRVSLQEATNAALAHFDAADTNHDGTVSVEEMRAAHKAMMAKPGRR